MTCQCGHVDDEHGGDPKYPGSTACNVKGCDCIAFDQAEDPEGFAEWNDGNIYYSPQKFGLKTVGEIDTGGSYEFDIFVVFKDSDGRFFCAHDSGCSCPTPFESFGLPNLARVTSISNLRTAIKSKFDERSRKPSPSDIAQLVGACRAEGLA